jgi:hypothetical protein
MYKTAQRTKRREGDTDRIGSFVNVFAEREAQVAIDHGPNCSHRDGNRVLAWIGAFSSISAQAQFQGFACQE